MRSMNSWISAPKPSPLLASHLSIHQCLPRLSEENSYPMVMILIRSLSCATPKLFKIRLIHILLTKALTELGS
jgi:hypothetical protein